MPNPSPDKPIELKACPFCGGPAVAQRYRRRSWGAGCTSSECQHTLTAEAYGTSRQRAIAAWNTRAEASQLAGVVGERIAAALDASGNDELVEAITQSVVRHVWNVPPGPSWPVVTSVRKGVRAAISRTQERSNG